MKTRHFLAALLTIGALTSPLSASQEVKGYGPWRFGMTRAEVQAVEEAGPYAPVGSTGGLETKNGSFMSQTRNVSFVFGPAGLSHIQIWAYVGEDQQQAIQEFNAVYRYLVENFGPVHQDGDPWPSDLTAEAFASRIPPAFRQGSSSGAFMKDVQAKGSGEVQIVKLHLHPQKPVAGAEVYGSLIHSPNFGSSWVFLYFKSPGDRRQ